MGPARWWGVPSLVHEQGVLDQDIPNTCSASSSGNAGGHNGSGIGPYSVSSTDFVFFVSCGVTIGGVGCGFRLTCQCTCIVRQHIRHKPPIVMFTSGPSVHLIRLYNLLGIVRPIPVWNIPHDLCGLLSEILGPTSCACRNELAIEVIACDPLQLHATARTLHCSPQMGMHRCRRSARPSVRPRACMNWREGNTTMEPRKNYQGITREAVQMSSSTILDFRQLL